MRLKASATLPGSRDIDRQVGDAIARLVGRVEIEGEYLGALVEKAKGDRIADTAAAPVIAATLPENSPAMVALRQYISQPPLTLIVAPVM